MKLALSATRTRMIGFGQGISLAIIIAVASFGVHSLPVMAALSPMIVAILIGMVVKNVWGISADLYPGISFGSRRLLRIAIVLLGFQLSLGDIATIGPVAALTLILVVVATLGFCCWFGPFIGVDRRLAELIGAGTSICGASATVAMSSVTNAQEEDVTYAVAAVTIFGTICMLVYPVLWHVVELTPEAYGIWAGASIHEVAQVVAASFQIGKSAGDFAVIAKLSRVLLLVPVIVIFSALYLKRSFNSGEAGPAPFPLFVVGFVIAVLLNTAISIPTGWKEPLMVFTTFILTVALGALGLETDIRKLKSRGVKPLLLAAAASLFISGLSFALVRAFYS